MTVMAVSKLLEDLESSSKTLLKLFLSGKYMHTVHTVHTIGPHHHSLCSSDCRRWSISWKGQSIGNIGTLSPEPSGDL
jgi:hypothetical protein